MTTTPPGRWVLRGGTVIDPRDGSRHPNTDVVVAGTTIADVRPAGTATDGPVVDATGRFVVPGFNDMHAHPLELNDPRGSLELMLAHGVTGYRQMSGSTALLRRRAAGGDLHGTVDAPELLALPGALLTPLNAGNAARAIRTVREQAAAGADFVKVAVVSADVSYRILTEGRRLGIPVAGHLPVGVDVRRVSRDGWRSIEHLGPGVGLFAPCSDHEHGLQEEARARPPLRVPPLPFLEPLLRRALRRILINPTNRVKPADVALMAEAVRTFDAGKARAIAEQFVVDGTWNVPTLVRELTTYRCDSTDLAHADDLRYVAPAALTAWRKAAATFASFPAATRATYRAAYDRLRELTALFDEVGVPMLAGSDVCGAAWLVPGASLHHEFDELARAGLSPLRVLQMTTSRAAEFLDATDVLGTVAAGRRADVVILNADPLADVGALHRIDGVVRAGRYLSRTDLDAIKHRVAAERSVA